MLKKLCKTLTIIFLTLAGHPGNATPEYVVTTHDQLLGANANSFFVMRTVTIMPGSYYNTEYRTLFLELSAWDGHIRHSCTLRRALAETDPDVDNWVLQETTPPPCDMAGHMRNAGAWFVRPTRTSENHALRLSRQGLDIRWRNEDATEFSPLLGWPYIDTRARAMGVIDDLGDTGMWRDVPDTQCPWCEMFPAGGQIPDTMFENPDFPACAVGTDIAAVPSSGWVFARFICNSDNTDTHGAVFYVPISLETYDASYEE